MLMEYLLKRKLKELLDWFKLSFWGDEYAEQR